MWRLERAEFSKVFKIRTIKCVHHLEDVTADTGNRMKVLFMLDVVKLETIQDTILYISI